MPHTLITGANGFVGATMINQTLAEGHTVTACVRSKKAFDDLVATHPEWDLSKLDFVEVKDYTAEDVFDDIFKKGDFDYVLHVAAPMLDDPENTDFVKHYEKPSIEGNRQLLKSAAKYGKKVKAVSVTGSINAMTTGDPEDVKKRVFTEKEWLPLDREDAIKSQNPYIMYCVGKKVAEQAIWEFVETEKPSFHVSNFNPALIFGPPLQHIRSMKKINFSIDQFYSIFNGTSEVVPNTAFPAYIDVRDLAALHIKALTTPAAANKRFVLGSPTTYNDISHVLKTMPNLTGKLSRDNDEAPVMPRIDTTAVRKAIPIKWHTLEETVQQTAQYLLELEKKHSRN